MKNNVEAFAEEIKSEDELPSGAGIYFRVMLGLDDYRGDWLLGDREMVIVSDWLERFTELQGFERKELVDNIQ